jgi:hypothetical protein
MKDTAIKTGTTVKNAATKDLGFLSESSKKFYETAILGTEDEEDEEEEE